MTRKAPPPDACQLTARYLLDAETKFVSHAEAVCSFGETIRKSAFRSTGEEVRTADLDVVVAVLWLGRCAVGVTVRARAYESAAHLVTFVSQFDPRDGRERERGGNGESRCWVKGRVAQSASCRTWGVVARSVARMLCAGPCRFPRPRHWGVPSLAASSSSRHGRTPEGRKHSSQMRTSESKP